MREEIEKILKCDEIPHYLQEGIANDIHLIEESVRAKNDESLHLVSACYRCGYDEAIFCLLYTSPSPRD